MRKFSFAGGYFPPGKKTLIMGILNYTPDSFSDGDVWFTPGKAVERAAALCEDGADIIDVGACSTRPFAALVSEEEEIRRLGEILRDVKGVINVPLSVDTFRPAVARFALENGADIINDVGGEFNAETAAAVKEYGAGWILMHSGGKNSADENPYPLGVVSHVQLFFDSALESCLDFGIEREHVCLDPGFGFAKTNAQNIELLKNLDKLDTHGAALLAALSRKRFIGELSGEEDKTDRLFGTLAGNIVAVSRGADIIRVHDVKNHIAAIKTIDGLKNSAEQTD